MVYFYSFCYEKFYVLRCILLLLEFNSSNWCRIAANFKVKVKHAPVLTGYLKPKESQEKRENSHDPPPPTTLISVFPVLSHVD